MAISYFEAASWTTPGTGVSTSYYKDITFTGVSVGDLLVVSAGSAGAGSVTPRGAVATQSGTTGAWTTSIPSTVASNNCGAVGGYALATSSGTIVVRVTLSNQTTSTHFGVAGMLIPAAEVGASYGWATSFTADADGQLSVTLAGSSTVFYFGYEWNALTLTSTASTPVATTYHRRLTEASIYSVYVASWLAQASGTRNYGPSGISGAVFAGMIFRMDTAAGGSTPTSTSTASIALAFGGSTKEVERSASTLTAALALGGTSKEVEYSASGLTLSPALGGGTAAASAGNFPIALGLGGSSVEVEKSGSDLSLALALGGTTREIEVSSTSILSIALAFGASSKEVEYSASDLAIAPGLGGSSVEVEKSTSTLSIGLVFGGLTSTPGTSTSNAVIALALGGVTKEVELSTSISSIALTLGGSSKEVELSTGTLSIPLVLGGGDSEVEGGTSTLTIGLAMGGSTREVEKSSATLQINLTLGGLTAVVFVGEPAGTPEPLGIELIEVRGNDVEIAFIRSAQVELVSVEHA